MGNFGPQKPFHSFIKSSFFIHWANISFQDSVDVSDDDDVSFVGRKVVKKGNISDDDDSPVAANRPKSKYRFFDGSEDDEAEPEADRPKPVAEAAEKVPKKRNPFLDESSEDEVKEEEAARDERRGDFSRHRDTFALHRDTSGQVSLSSDGSSDGGSDQEAEEASDGEAEEDSAEAEEEEEEDSDGDYVVSSSEDFESPAAAVPPRGKTPRKAPAVKPSEPVSENDDSVFVYDDDDANWAQPVRAPAKPDDDMKFNKVLVQPFNDGQKFSKGEVGVLETRLAAVRKSIERVIYFLFASSVWS